MSTEKAAHESFGSDHPEVFPYLYQVLGFEPSRRHDITQLDIRKRFLHMSLRTHDDKKTGDGKNQGKQQEEFLDLVESTNDLKTELTDIKITFLHVREAYRILYSPELREKYDREVCLAQDRLVSEIDLGPSYSEQQTDDYKTKAKERLALVHQKQNALIERFVQDLKTQKPFDFEEHTAVTISVPLTLDQVELGAVFKDLKYKAKSPCTKCDIEIARVLIECPVCLGAGNAREYQQTGADDHEFQVVLNDQEACQECSGLGHKVKCDECNGRMEIVQDRTISCSFLPGVAFGAAGKIVAMGVGNKMQDSWRRGHVNIVPELKVPEMVLGEQTGDKSLSAMIETIKASMRTESQLLFAGGPLPTPVNVKTLNASSYVTRSKKDQANLVVMVEMPFAGLCLMPSGKYAYTLDLPGNRAVSWTMTPEMVAELLSSPKRNLFLCIENAGFPVFGPKRDNPLGGDGGGRDDDDRITHATVALKEQKEQSEIKSAGLIERKMADKDETLKAPESKTENAPTTQQRRGRVELFISIAPFAESDMLVLKELSLNHDVRVQLSRDLATGTA